MSFPHRSNVAEATTFGKERMQVSEVKNMPVLSMIKNDSSKCVHRLRECARAESASTTQATLE